MKSANSALMLVGSPQDKLDILFPVQSTTTPSSPGWVTHEKCEHRFMSPESPDAPDDEPNPYCADEDEMHKDTVTKGQTTGWQCHETNNDGEEEGATMMHECNGKPYSKLLCEKVD